MTDMERFDWVLGRVSECMGVPRSILLSPTREARSALARQIAYYVLREQGMTLVQIGAGLGGRDHSTIHHGARRIGRLLATDKEVQAAVMFIGWIPEQEDAAENESEKMLASLVKASEHLSGLIDQQQQFLRHLRVIADGLKVHTAAALAADMMARQATNARKALVGVA